MEQLPAGVIVSQYDTKKLIGLWKQIKEHDASFLDGDMHDPVLFVDKLIPGSIVLEVEGGILWFEKIKPGFKATFYFLFWDHKLSPKQETIKRCIESAFLTFNLERLETSVPSYASAVRRFLDKKLGFAHEGVLRNSMKKKGELIDVHLYAILKEEVM